MKSPERYRPPPIDVVSPKKKHKTYRIEIDDRSALWAGVYAKTRCL